MEKQLPVTLLIVGLVVGGFVGYGVAPKGEDSQGGFTLPGVEMGRVQELEQEVTELNARIDRAREQFPGEVTTLSGEIISLGSGSLTLSSLALSNPLADIPSTITIRIDGETVVRRFVFKDSAAFAREQAAFFEQIDADGLFPEGLDPPESYTLQEVSASELTEGMYINIDAGSNIEGQSSVTAVSIDIVLDAGEIVLDPGVIFVPEDEDEANL